MTQQVLMSQLKDRAAFEQEVQKHISRMKAFNHEVGKPRPTAHPLVEASIKRVQAKGRPDNFIADYEIVDDVNAGVPLEDRKQLLVHKLTCMEVERYEQLLPQRKRRLFNLKLREIRDVKSEERTSEHEALLAKNKEINDAQERVSKVVAQAMSDIDDLTEDTIGAWEPPSLD